MLTGATGFVGRHLFPMLSERGYEVVGATRSPERARLAFPGREFRRLDVTGRLSAEAALQGCQAAFYLVHGMAGGAGYEEVERRSARAFSEAAARAGVSRIIYLGGIRPRGPISRHLSSRLRVGEILREGPVPTLELQASMIIGGGSESWRIVRDLAARLPFMVLPAWLDHQTQPIGIGDVTFALARALELPLPASRALALPGPEVLSAREIILRTARLLGSRPLALRVPVVTPKLSSYWITFITRADQRISEELVEGLLSDLVSEDEGFWRLAPEHTRMSFDAAARAALLDEQRDLSMRARVAELLIRTLSFGAIKRVSSNDA
ncbi:MAG TPA: NAD(P)H-binding protein [Longimicrobiales bacterium]|nr:NAD(P)H-binding protein [Longimicrobiales bacterium]